jgi:hypothetical protein
MAVVFQRLGRVCRPVSEKFFQLFFRLSIAAGQGLGVVWRLLVWVAGAGTV